ncbi:tubulin monoglycylase TTLL3-like, partial [Anoplopoma fimbria]|uniref:tubulin monoglycylase TTLL3-like n=1 Tax=Anoplopoma fimbria TaxID=229290 RepID=UPI0023EC29E1
PARLKTAKTLVAKAVKLRKVFSVQGPYPVIHAALWARGWVERLPHPAQRATHCHGNEEDDGDDGDVSVDVTERVDEGEKEENLDDMYDLMSRLVRNETTYFHWTTRRDYIDCRSLRNDQMTNHYANSWTFTTKVGLCVNLRNLQWFDTADPDTFFPRCYRLGAEDEKHAFIEDFRKTACTSLLQHVVESSRWRRDGAEELDNVEYRFVGPGMIDMALHVCQEFLNVLEHGDIDVTVKTPPSVEEQQWAEFLQDYYMVVHEGALISGSSVFVERCQATLIRLQEACPQLDTDGLNNIWIIKSGAKSRGRGIMCMNRLEEILELVDSDRALSKESKWVVQKYLERPLLVHGTKFDLRQWFLVTDWNPLTVWFYRECYLRFSTQPYSTKTLDSSVHLCNNSIQKHFQPSRAHPGVPEDNMWSCSQFRAYLQRQGRGAEWESVVVTGMQQAVVRALQTAQDLVEPRKASFELYGADFMLGRDLRPWLLEINASPTMACSTAVTSRLCPAVQLDTLRVVLDRRTDPSAYTGGFQLIFKQAAVEVPQYVGVNLLVEGAPIRRSRPLLHRQTVIFNPTLAIQSPLDQSLSEKVETSQKPSGQRSNAVSAFRHSGKENLAAGKIKRQLTSTSPKSEPEGKTDVKNTSCVNRSCRSLACEQPLVVHTEPQRKAQRWGLSFGANGVTLVPRSFSFSLSPPHSKSQADPGHGSHISRSFFPQTAFEPQHRTPNRVFPSLRGPLPTLEVLSLQPNIVVGTTACRNPNLSSHPSVPRHQLFLCSRRQSTAKFKGECTGEHKNQWY